MKRTIDYILDEHKLGKPMMFSTHGVSSDLADVEFSMIRDEHIRKNNRDQSDSENLAMHIIQSHAPTDQVTAEEALEIAEKTAEEFTGNDYSYVIAVHTDTEKIHAHIIVNAYSHTGKNKFFKKNALDDLLEISNKYCHAYGLSTSKINRDVKRPQGYSKKLQYVNKPSNREKLKHLIDELIKRSNSFDEFLEDVQTLGIEVNYRGGLSFLLPDAKQPIRLSSLRDERYNTIEVLTHRIATETAVGKVVTLEELKAVLQAEKQIEKQPVPTIPSIPQSKQWVSYYSKDYWKRRSEDLENIGTLAKMLSHLKDGNITSASDYITLIDNKIGQIESIKKQTTKYERQYDNKVDLYKNPPKVLRLDKKELETEMIDIRTKIKGLNHQYKAFQSELTDLQKFREIFEKSTSNERQRKKQLKL